MMGLTSEDTCILLDQIVVAHTQCQAPYDRSAMLVAASTIEWLVMEALMRRCSYAKLLSCSCS